MTTQQQTESVELRDEQLTYRPRTAGEHLLIMLQEDEEKFCAEHGDDMCEHRTESVWEYHPDYPRC